MQLIIMKMKMKMESRSHRYDINRPGSSHGHKYSKYKRCLTVMMHICIKQHLSNIWSSIHEKIKQYWGWVEKKALLIKKRVSLFKSCSYEIQNSNPFETSRFMGYSYIVLWKKESIHSSFWQETWVIPGIMYSRVGHVKFVEDSL